MSLFRKVLVVLHQRGEEAKNTKYEACNGDEWCCSNLKSPILVTSNAFNWLSVEIAVLSSWHFTSSKTMYSWTCCCIHFFRSRTEWYVRTYEEEYYRGTFLYWPSSSLWGRYLPRHSGPGRCGVVRFRSEWPIVWTQWRNLLAISCPFIYSWMEWVRVVSVAVLWKDVVLGSFMRANVV